MRRNWIALAAASIVLAILSACTSAVFLSSIDDGVSGLSYHLPRTLLTIKIEAVGRQANDVVAQLTQAESDAAGPTGVVRVSAHIDGQTYSVLVDNKGALTQPVVTSLRLVDVTSEQVADLSYNYVLQYDPKANFSDRVCVGVDGNGLLRYAEAGTKDETANIIVSIAKFAGRLAGTEAFTVSGAPQTVDALLLKIDPFDPSDRRAVSKAIAERYPEFRGRYEFGIEGIPRPREPSRRESCPPDRICYRTVVPMRIGLFDRRSKGNSARYAMVANLTEVNNIDVRRAFFVEKVTRLGFVDGMLAYARISKPSEALEAAKLPLTVYDAVMTSALAAPSQFLGQITPGTDPATVMTILTQQQQTTSKINDLQAELQRLREDLPPGAPVGVAPQADAVFKIECAQPTPKPTQNNTAGSSSG